MKVRWLRVGGGGGRTSRSSLERGAPLTLCVSVWHRVQRVESGGTWSLFCPNEAPGLSDCWGKEFEDLYQRYESEGRQRETISAHKLWFAIIESQIETGTPYVLFKVCAASTESGRGKGREVPALGAPAVRGWPCLCNVSVLRAGHVQDACNAKSNHQHLGTIKSSNLCTEIIEYTAPGEVAVCNLASISLGMFVDEATKTYDFDKLAAVVRVVTRNLNKVCNRGFVCGWLFVPTPRRVNGCALSAAVSWASGHRPELLPRARGAHVQHAAPTHRYGRPGPRRRLREDENAVRVARGGAAEP